MWCSFRRVKGLPGSWKAGSPTGLFQVKARKAIISAGTRSNTHLESWLGGTGKAMFGELVPLRRGPEP